MTLCVVCTSVLLIASKWSGVFLRVPRQVSVGFLIFFYFYFLCFVFVAVKFTDAR